METKQLQFAKALADKNRLKIMTQLCCVWLSVNDLVEQLGVEQSTVSHHLKTLKAAELVLVRQEGKHRYYTLNQEQLTLCCGMLVQSFAPDYAATIVPVSSIQEASGD
ncbi:MAG: winged helix-turn-helix transcriptional regulator [Chloroflexi bacterium]|nr:winged helix-turn-helix transcriptional regulator [Chloroflexota bacterium]